MPTYTFLNSETNEEFTEFMKISEMEEFLATNLNIKLIPASPRISYNDLKKPNDCFRDRLKEIKKSHRGNTINVY